MDSFGGIVFSEWDNIDLGGRVPEYCLDEVKVLFFHGLKA